MTFRARAGRAHCDGPAILERRRRRFWLAAASALTVGVLGACTSTGPEQRGAEGSSPSSADSPGSSASTSPGESGAETGTPPTGSATGAPTDVPFEPREITVVMNGDMLLHSGLWDTARIDAQTTGRGVMDYRPLLSDMRPVVSGADLAICHMETPLAPPGGPFYSYPVFSAPPAIVPALKWAGYDACTTASNHSIDQGFDGLVRTLEDFDKSGIVSAGTAETRQESITPVLLDVGDVSVGLISATYGTNGIPLPEDQPWSVPLIKPDKILRMAAEARADGADVVLVALHWGSEYVHEPSTDQVAVAEALTRSPDIDFIYGHHAHVVQPYDKVNGTWVVYGLGNAVAQQDTAVEGVYDGNTCRVTLREHKDGTFDVVKLEYIPTMITPFDGVHPMRLLNVPQSLKDPADASLHAELAATEQRVTAAVNLEQAFAHGVVEGE